MSEILNSKIRRYIKKLKKQKIKYSFKRAYDLIYNQIKLDEAYNDEDMEHVADEIWSRLKENWPFKDVI